MNTNDLILARISEIRAIKSKSVNAFAEILNMPQATVNNYILGKRKISVEFLMAILSSFEDVSSDWLLLGKGEMLRTAKPEQNVYDINYGNQVNGNNNITGNTAPVTFSTDDAEDAYNELASLRAQNRELQRKLDEANDRNAALTDKLLKLI